MSLNLSRSSGNAASVVLKFGRSSSLLKGLRKVEAISSIVLFPAFESQLRKTANEFSPEKASIGAAHAKQMPKMPRLEYRARLATLACQLRSQPASLPS